eukprot:131120_1
MDLAFIKLFRSEMKLLGLGYHYWNSKVTKIESLNPASEGFTIIGKIIAIKYFEGTKEAVIADSTASVTILLKKHQVNLIARINKGDCLVLNDAKIEMKGRESGSFMRVIVSQKRVQTVAFDWNDEQFEYSNNLSETEYELLKDTMDTW